MIKEGKGPEKIIRVGNIIIDSLEMMRFRTEKENTVAAFQLEKQNHCLVTLYRPSNVDEPEIIASFMKQLESIGTRLPILFPVHPPTRKNLG